MCPHIECEERDGGPHLRNSRFEQWPTCGPLGTHLGQRIRLPTLYLRSGPFGRPGAVEATIEKVGADTGQMSVAIEHGPRGSGRERGARLGDRD